ncbi:MAG: diaminopimelate epimerase [Syntrophobacteraceae bacterium]
MSEHLLNFISKDEGRIRFVKMTGSGNDFILIDNRELQIDPSRYLDLVRLACRRRQSVGSDGLILIENDEEVDFRWRFFNADGSEAEMCGNGARCAARFAYLKGIMHGNKTAFRTLAGIIEAEIRGEKVKIRVPDPQCLMLGLSLQAEERLFAVDFINTGVPHAICFLENEGTLEREDVFRWGQVLRRHPFFQPAGTNVNFVVLLNDRRLSIRTYERGVEDETLACGTGSIASALIAAAGNLAFSPVEVLTRSGETLTVYFEQSRNRGEAEFTEVYLEGDAKVVYEAELWNETLIR